MPTAKDKEIKKMDDGEDVPVPKEPEKPKPAPKPEPEPAKEPAAKAEPIEAKPKEKPKEEPEDDSKKDGKPTAIEDMPPGATKAKEAEGKPEAPSEIKAKKEKLSGESWEMVPSGPYGPGLEDLWNTHSTY